MNENDSTKRNEDDFLAQDIGSDIKRLSNLLTRRAGHLAETNFDREQLRNALPELKELAANILTGIGAWEYILSE